MGIIPTLAQDAAARYTADVVTDPLPAAVAAVLAALAVIGPRLYGAMGDACGLAVGPASWLRRRLPPQSSRPALAAVLPRLPQRLPHTRPARPADAPAVWAWGLLRGPPGSVSRPTRTDACEGPVR